MRRLAIAILFASLHVLAAPAYGVERFPPPELPPEYVEPEFARPTPDARLAPSRTLNSGVYEAINIVLLTAGMALATWLIYKRRSRAGLIALTAGALFVFGFYRYGCICPIGSIQNVTLGLFDSRPPEMRYAVPWFVLALFVLPIAFSLFYGRVFCSSICPLGAAQELVLIRPVKVPGPLSAVLGLAPFFILGVGVLMAANNGGFLFCRYDPFVGIFRLSGAWWMIAFGVGLLLLSTVVGRPYCRYLCPLSAIFRIVAPVARHRVTVTPDDCIRCRLCEDACPYGAIRLPNKAQEVDRQSGRRRLIVILLTMPLALAGFGWLGSRVSERLARTHPTVSLAERIALEEHGVLDIGSDDATDTFWRQSGSVDELFAEALALRGRYRTGGWLLGFFGAAAIGGSLIGASVKRTRSDYVPDPGLCVACGRCWASCPIEHRRQRPGPKPTAAP